MTHTLLRKRTSVASHAHLEDADEEIDRGRGDLVLPREVLGVQRGGDPAASMTLEHAEGEVAAPHLGDDSAVEEAGRVDQKLYNGPCEEGNDVLFAARP